MAVPDPRTVREYAHEKLLAEEDASLVFTSHSAYYLRLAEETEPKINTSERQTWLALLEREHSNLRTAIERASRAGEYGNPSRLAVALFWFWFHRGYRREGRTFLGHAINQETAPTGARARALPAMAFWRGRRVIMLRPAPVPRRRPTRCIFLPWYVLPKATRRSAVGGGSRQARPHRR